MVKITIRIDHESGAFGGPELAPGPEVIEEFLLPVFIGMLEKATLTSVSWALRRLAADAWPNHRLAYSETVIDRHLRANSVATAPMLVTRPLWLLILNDNLLNERSSEATSDFDAFLRTGASLALDLGLHLNPLAESLVRLFSGDPQRIYSRFAASFDPYVHLEIPASSWDAQLGPIWSAWSNGWLWPVIANQEPPSVFDFSSGQIEGLDTFTGMLTNEALYGVEEANSIASCLLDRAMPLEGPGGKVLVVHNNDPQALELCNRMAARVSGAKPPRRVCLGALADPAFSYGADFLPRQVDVLRKKSCRWSTRAIARGWLETGVVNTPKPHGREELQSAESQVRRVWRELKALR